MLHLSGLRTILHPLNYIHILFTKYLVKFRNLVYKRLDLKIVFFYKTLKVYYLLLFIIYILIEQVLAL